MNRHLAARRAATVFAGAFLTTVLAASAGAQSLPLSAAPAVAAATVQTKVQKAAPVPAAAPAVAPVSPVSAAVEKKPCNPHAELTRLASPLGNVARKVASGEPVTIVAIGSSSTWGAGASTREAAYPARLAEELRQAFPGHPITVINQGVGGEEINDMMKRFDAVIAAKPDLVIWQFGTNAVVRNENILDKGPIIHDAVERVRRIGGDMMLIDPQFTPAVVKATDTQRVVDMFAMIAKRENIDLYRRWAVMEHWNKIENIGFDTFSAPDGLHMNDWGYACMAKGLGMVIADAVKRPVLSATAMPGASALPNVQVEW